MRRQSRLLFILVMFLTMTMIQSVSGQAPPPPSHSQNGNQTSPGGGTGCPIDRTQGIYLVLSLSLVAAGVVLYRRGNKAEA